MWLPGGCGDSDVYRDVWYSLDGADWSLAQASAEWPKRSSHTVLAFDGKLWLHGGFLDYAGTLFANDVWYSNGLGGIGETPNAEARVAYRLPTIVRGLLQLPGAASLKPQAASHLLDISGREVLNLHPGANDVSRLGPGIYFVRSASIGEREVPSVTKVIVAK